MTTTLVVDQFVNDTFLTSNDSDTISEDSGEFLQEFEGRYLENISHEDIKCLLKACYRNQSRLKILFSFNNIVCFRNFCKNIIH